MKVHTFMGKVSIDGLHEMEGHVNEWLAEHPVKVVDICQSFGMHKHHDGRREEPVLLITLWYEPVE
ncbi:MAG TPA: hypothetical protein PKI11_00440 [Candidatus Hydrogenedentes bacterium]|nr:hypothetical protein [Candidatus Hydrogenedentota bacterium]HNT86388.1 hypothetical protein [Candidatus Hydrogenedentota bacterium]